MDSKKALCAAAVFGELLAFFPFAVMCGVGFGRFSAALFSAFYACLLIFYFSGYFVSRALSEAALSKRKKRVFTALSKLAAAIPAGTFLIVSMKAGLHPIVYISVLPASVAAYFAAYYSAGRPFTRRFTRGWFFVYLVSAVVTLMFMNSADVEELFSRGNLLLCVGFAVMSVLTAIIANQTAIEGSTRRRADENTVLPKGLRAKNAFLVGGASLFCALFFLFAKPISEGLLFVLSRVVYAVLFIMSLFGGLISGSTGNPFLFELAGATGENAFRFGLVGELFIILAFVILIYLIIKFRRGIWAAIKNLFAPLFRTKKDERLPYIDEVSDGERPLGARERKKLFKSAVRRYRKERDPEKKYRLGYEIFLRSLEKTKAPPLASDTTKEHCEAGKRLFGESSFDEQKCVYDALRYGGKIPAAEQIKAQEALIEELERMTSE